MDSVLATTIAVTGVGLVVIGSMGIAGTLGAHTVAWTTFGLSLAPTTYTLINGRRLSLPEMIMSLVFPILAALSAYGFIPIIAIGALGVAQGGIRLICLSSLLEQIREGRLMERRLMTV